MNLWGKILFDPSLDTMQNHEDPSQVLPCEIFEMVLLNLDGRSLVSSTEVCKEWYDHATNDGIIAERLKRFRKQSLLCKLDERVPAARNRPGRILRIKNLLVMYLSDIYREDMVFKVEDIWDVEGAPLGRLWGICIRCVLKGKIFQTLYVTGNDIHGTRIALAHHGWGCMWECDDSLYSEIKDALIQEMEHDILVFCEQLSVVYLRKTAS